MCVGRNALPLRWLGNWLSSVRCELVLAFFFILYAVDLNVDLAQQFCWSGLFCLSSLQLHQIHHTVHIHFLQKPPNLNLFIWSREAKMFCWITNSLFIVKSRSAHWHTVRFSLSLSLCLFPTVSETHLKIKDIHIQDLLRARNIYFICPSAKIKMKQERSIHLNTNELAELQIFTF